MIPAFFLTFINLPLEVGDDVVGEGAVASPDATNTYTFIFLPALNRLECAK